ncbi:hypothetical protein NC652_007385 [Populus alba x Populus x berolinensis]|nr:hypothetical protein NC652_007385 [Populus alba x Populus x berolinensis]
MAKLKKQSSSLWSGGRDFTLQTSGQMNLRLPRVQLRSLSPVQSDHESSSQALPPRPRLTFGDFASFPRGTRVSPNTRYKSSSLASYANKYDTPDGSRINHTVSSERATTSLSDTATSVRTSSGYL